MHFLNFLCLFKLQMSTTDNSNVVFLYNSQKMCICDTAWYANKLISRSSVNLFSLLWIRVGFLWFSPNLPKYKWLSEQVLTQVVIHFVPYKHISSWTEPRNRFTRRSGSSTPPERSCSIFDTVSFSSFLMFSVIFFPLSYQQKQSLF